MCPVHATCRAYRTYATKQYTRTLLKVNAQESGCTDVALLLCLQAIVPDSYTCLAIAHVSTDIPYLSPLLCNTVHTAACIDSASFTVSIRRRSACNKGRNTRKPKYGKPNRHEGTSRGLIPHFGQDYAAVHASSRGSIYLSDDICAICLPHNNLSSARNKTLDSAPAPRHKIFTLCPALRQHWGNPLVSRSAEERFTSALRARLNQLLLHKIA